MAECHPESCRATKCKQPELKAIVVESRRGTKIKAPHRSNTRMSKTKVTGRTRKQPNRRKQQPRRRKSKCAAKPKPKCGNSDSVRGVPKTGALVRRVPNVSERLFGREEGGEMNPQSSSQVTENDTTVQSNCKPGRAASKEITRQETVRLCRLTPPSRRACERPF